MGKSILIPVDSSEQSKAALEWCLTNIAAQGDSITLFNVMPESILPVPMVLEPMGGSHLALADNEEMIQAIKDKVKAQVSEFMDKLAVLCKDKGVEHHSLVRLGDAKEEIVTLCEEKKFDLLVMGCRGLGQLKRLVMGSVSNYCVHHAPCPVLVYRTQDMH